MILSEHFLLISIDFFINLYVFRYVRNKIFFGLLLKLCYVNKFLKFPTLYSFFLIFISLTVFFWKNRREPYMREEELNELLFGRKETERKRIYLYYIPFLYHLLHLHYYHHVIIRHQPQQQQEQLFLGVLSSCNVCNAIPIMRLTFWYLKLVGYLKPIYWWKWASFYWHNLSYAWRYGIRIGQMSHSNTASYNSNIKKALISETHHHTSSLSCFVYCTHRRIILTTK